MNPAPAISTLASAALSGSAATSASASLRGLRRVALARRMAILVAKSPCWASRVRSTSKATSRSAAGSSDSGNCAKRLPQQLFDQSLQGESASSQRVGSLPRRAAAKVSIYLQGIDIDRPAQARRARAGTPPAAATSSRSAAAGPASRSRSTDALESDRRGARSRRSPGRARWPHRPRALVRGRRRRCRNSSKARAVLGFGPQHRETRVGRPARGAPLLERGGREGLVASRDQTGEQRVLGKGGLNHALRPDARPARRGPPPG